MPKAQEAALGRVADQKGFTGERRNAFIYGSLRRRGWRPKREKHTAADAAQALARRRK
jgi:hypothetical protein